MIKIIKEGIKEFTATCPFCYCEFTYEKEDAYNGVVSCPCCGATIDVTRHTNLNKRSYGSNRPGTTAEPVILDNMVWETPEYRKFQNALEKQVKQPLSVKYENHCLKCPFFKDYLLSGKAYVGDSPCQWCQYGGLKITCTSTETSVNEVE